MLYDTYMYIQVMLVHVVPHAQLYIHMYIIIGSGLLVCMYIPVGLSDWPAPPPPLLQVKPVQLSFQPGPQE